MDYVQITPPQRQRMLEQIGVTSVDDLFCALPAEVRLAEPLDLPGPLSELELQQALAELASANRTAEPTACFMGGGAYDHFIPALVDEVASKGQFLTAYTPYQAEASQGVLQVFFEFQTQIARLTGLDVANASLYEGASAAAEAMHLAVSVTGKRRVLVGGAIHPHIRAVLRTAADGLPIELVEIPACARTGRLEREALLAHLDDDTAAVLVQSPNVVGLVEDWADLFDTVHRRSSALAVGLFHPLACALIKSPGLCGADIACAEGQPLGIPLQYGGPYLGLFAVRRTLMRKMPGRLIGATTDAHGRRAFCLTLQTREQHIRGAKATSNICTNQGLLAVRASAYLAALGPAGLRRVAELCYHKAHYAAGRIAELPGYELPFADQPFFNEFLVNCPGPVERLIDAGRNLGILPGVAADRLGIGHDRQLLIAVTEKRTRAQIDQLVQLLSETRP